MTTWRARFSEMESELRQNPLLEVVRCEYRPPAPPDLIREIERSVGGELPRGLPEFFREMNGFKLEWQVRDKSQFDTGEPPWGSIELLELGFSAWTVFSDWEGVVWFKDGDDQGFKPVKPIDFFTPEACAALYPVPGAMMIHYHYLGEDLHPTGYAFSEYLELLLKSRGYVSWQTSLCVDLQTFSSTENFRRNMPRIFPGYDDTLFVPKTVEGEIKKK